MNNKEEKQTENKINECQNNNTSENIEQQEEKNTCESNSCNCQKKEKKQKQECKCDENKKEKKAIFKKDNKEIEKLNNQIKELTSQVATYKETLLRNQAELQNYKRRKDEENAKILKYKDEEIIKEYLTILDNFERAIKMDDNDLTDEVSRFLEGFKLIYTNTIGMLSKFEVKEINAEGVEFDPEYHHAVLTDHDENKPEGVVLEVLQKGYMYKDRVIRPAMVKVNE